MKTVAQLLRTKPAGIVSIRPDAVVLDAIKLLAEKSVGALVVLEDGRLVGIVSERDYARKIILQGKSSATALVSEIMTREIVSVTPAHTNVDCMTLMTEQRIRHLPVLDNAQVVGVLSMGDILKDLISEQQFTIDQLTNYIGR